MTWVRTTPRRVWAVCAFFAFLQPITHALVFYCAPDSAVPTGLHKPDSAIFIHAMRMFETGFYSPYTTCHSAMGDHSWRFFTTPFFLLYAIAGAIGSILHIGDFIMLGIANGFSAGCYLLAVYHFMRTVLPKRADLAFLFFAFCGGLGGPLYVACALLGVNNSHVFSIWFFRFAIYDLVEGQNLAPYLLMTRLYYTLPLAIGFAGLTSLIVAWRTRCAVHLVYAQLLLLVCTLLNARLGPPLCVIGLLYCRQCGWLGVLTALHVIVPIVMGVVVATCIMTLNPIFVGNVYAVVQQQMWLTSFVSAALPLLVLALPVVLSDMRKLSRDFRIVAWATLGYLAVYTVLFFFYQAYFGTLLIGADHAASLEISDLSLLGIALGLALYTFVRGENERVEHGWLVVWVVVFVAVAVSSFGHGWFLRFAPQRLMVFLGIPMSLLAAESIAHLTSVRPRFAKMCIAFVFTIGLTSLAVSTLVFQGPLGMHPGLASDIGMHAAYVPRADANCLEHLGPGVVAAPPPYNDSLSIRDGVKVIGGYGSTDLSDERSEKLDADVTRFFSPYATREQRAEFLKTWCVAHVFLPSDAWDHDAVAASLGQMSELIEICAEGGAHMYKVQ